MQRSLRAFRPAFYGVSGLGFTRPAAPPARATRSIHGTMVCWERQHHGAAQLRVDLMDDGSAELYVLRFDPATGGFTDEREVPIEPETFEALADTLFEPRTVEEEATDAECPQCEGARLSGGQACPVCAGVGAMPREDVALYWSQL